MTDPDPAGALASSQNQEIVDFKQDDAVLSRGDRRGEPAGCGTASQHEPIVTAATGPTAGDYLLRALDRWMPHADTCGRDECVACDVLINQLRLAYKVWQNSRHHQPSERPPARSLAVDPQVGIEERRQRAADAPSDSDRGAALGRLPLERDAIRALCAEAGMTPESTTLDYIRSAFYRLGKVQRELRERR